ncbi:MAG: hypothetical protein WKF96_05715 [Solirubrobacteraceae bacterium]
MRRVAPPLERPVTVGVAGPHAPALVPGKLDVDGFVDATSTPPPQPGRPRPIADAVRIVAWLSIAAGTIHAVATIDHFSHWWLYGVFFLALTYGQVLWGVALLRNPVSDRALRLGAIANLAIVVAWLFSRTIGVPIGPEAGSPEPIGTMDGAVVLVQLVTVAYVAMIIRPTLRVVRGLRVLIGAHRMRIGMMLASASVFAALLGGHQH